MKHVFVLAVVLVILILAERSVAAAAPYARETTTLVLERKSHKPSWLKRAQKILRAARSQIGVPYVWGGETPGRGFDCSGLVQWAFRKAGFKLPRTTSGQIAAGRPIRLSEIGPTDLVFTHGGGHVSIYVGGGRLINAPYTGARVRLRALRDVLGQVVSVRRIVKRAS
jgi:cell wall-associated NlpC family hydrolase